MAKRLPEAGLLAPGPAEHAGQECPAQAMGFLKLPCRGWRLRAFVEQWSACGALWVSACDPARVTSWSLLPDALTLGGCLSGPHADQQGVLGMTSAKGALRARDSDVSQQGSPPSRGAGKGPRLRTLRGEPAPAP